MLSCTPYLLFDGNCAEAMTFYQTCVGGKLTMGKLGDTTMKSQFPEEKYDRIINARIVNGPFDLSASDWMASPALNPVKGNMASIYLTSGDLSALKSVFKKLSDGADRDKTTFMELRPMPFGTYGQFTDKFGVSWIFKSDTKIEI